MPVMCGMPMWRPHRGSPRGSSFFRTAVFGLSPQGKALVLEVVLGLLLGTCPQLACSLAPHGHTATPPPSAGALNLCSGCADNRK
jgi:hypothetical protein